jgi:hypothetical protein
MSFDISNDGIYEVAADGTRTRITVASAPMPMKQGTRVRIL